MDELILKTLLEKYRLGTCSKEEIVLLESWYLSESKLPGEDITQNTLLQAHERIAASIAKNTGFPCQTQKPIIRLWPRIAAAASILLFLSIGGYFLLHKPGKNQISAIKPGIFKNDAVAGNMAVLTLGNGKKVTLTALNPGNIAKVAGKNVRKSKVGDLIYLKDNAASNSEIVYNTLTVPRGGGKHELTLSDGTLAILDAESSIRFPVNFTSSKRQVFITGQVYFEVTHNAHQPFSVRVGNETIEDIGTRFNISAFDLHPRTTLIEGSIKVNDFVLTPGQQSFEQDNGVIKILNHADMQEVLAWKNDMFVFNSETSLKTVMDQISRWYDMDVVYVNTGKTYELGGDMPRYSKLSDVLKILTYSGVKFSVDGKKIIVYQ
ncbi:FecR family protein [Mucilaginibacter frigoritolerans]|uniref:FecR family protein n=1 Tax=Mucilaginibacter frigoritolerans TaxID=652788 RepID=A0A562TVN7_9SPHI|nr:FecR family protein [Mucilaginibacter frigoritolerans]TWI97615.1 FecR family protein [Mucilaginibacter frigoritolerans]